MDGNGMDLSKTNKYIHDTHTYLHKYVHKSKAEPLGEETSYTLEHASLRHNHDERAFRCMA